MIKCKFFQIVTRITHLAVVSTTIIALTGCQKLTIEEMKATLAAADANEQIRKLVIEDENVSMNLTKQGIIFKKICIDGIYYWTSQTQGLRWVIGSAVMKNSFTPSGVIVTSAQACK